MEEKKQHFQHIMLYYFKTGKNATKTQKTICAVYGEGAMTYRTCQNENVPFLRQIVLNNSVFKTNCLKNITH